MNFFEELKRRNVFRVGVAYAIASWVLLQVADLVLEAIEAPSWVLQALMLIVGLGFIVALVVAWAYELTPEGVKREADVDRTQSIVGDTGRKLDRIIIGFLVIAVGVLLYRQSTLETVPGDVSSQERGNRAGVTEQPAPNTASQSTQAPDSTSKKSIAVLPFTTRSTSEDDRFFSDGMHDDLLTQLAKIGELKVISRTSMMEYRDTTKNLRQIGEELGVANILEGAVQRVGDKVRINVQLIDAQTDEHLWAETYDREMSLDNLLDIQSEMSRSIARAMETTLSPAEEAMIDRQLTDNLEAMDAYRRAKAFSDVFIANNLDRAEIELKHALSLDPAFAAAWALLAYVDMSRYWGVEPRPEYRESAWQSIELGRKIDPDLPELDIAEGYYHYWGFLDYEAALNVLEPVLEVYPGSFEVAEVLAYVNRRYGRMERALEYMHQAYEISPRDSRLIYSLGETYAALQDWDRAQEFLDQMQAIVPGHPRGYQLKAAIARQRDRNYRSAARDLELASADLNFFCWPLFDVLVLVGDYEKAQDIESCSIENTRRGNPLGGDLTTGLALRFAEDSEAAKIHLDAALGDINSRLEEDPDDFYLNLSLCLVQGGLGNAEATREACRNAETHMVVDAFAQDGLKIEIAKGMAMAGLATEALLLLEQALDDGIDVSAQETADHPAFRSINGDARWRQLMERLGVTLSALPASNLAQEASE